MELVIILKLNSSKIDVDNQLRKLIVATGREEKLLGLPEQSEYLEAWYILIRICICIFTLHLTTQYDFSFFIYLNT